MPLSRTQRAALKKKGFTPDDLKAIEAELSPADDNGDEPAGRRRRSTDKPAPSRRVMIVEGDDADALLSRLFDEGEGDDDQGDDDDEGDDDEPAPADDDKPPAVNRWFR
jgi:hypothetical protein